MGDFVEHLAGGVEAAVAGVEGEKLGGEEVGGGDGVEDEPGVELAGEVEEGEVVDAVLDEVTVGAEVEGARNGGDGE